MAVAEDSILAPPTTSVSTNPIARTHVAGTGGTNGYLVVIVHVKNPSATLTCTIGGNAADAIGFATTTSVSTYVFGLAVGTVTASQNIAISLTNTGLVACRLGSILFIGAAQSGVPASVADSAGTSNPQTTTAITAATGDNTASAYSIASGSSPTATLAAGTGAITQRWSSNGGAGGAAMGEGAYSSTVTAGGSFQYSWTGGTSVHGIVTLVVTAAVASLLPSLERSRHGVVRGPGPARGRF